MLKDEFLKGLESLAEDFDQELFDFFYAAQRRAMALIDDDAMGEALEAHFGKQRGMSPDKEL